MRNQIRSKVNNEVILCAMGLMLSDTEGVILRGREWKEEKYGICREVERAMEEIREVLR